MFLCLKKWHINNLKPWWHVLPLLILAVDFSFSSPALFQAGRRWVSLCSVYLNHSKWMTVDSHSSCRPCCEFWKSMHGSNTNSVCADILVLFFNITFTETLAIKGLVTICANFRRWSRDYVISIALTRSWMERGYFCDGRAGHIPARQGTLNCMVMNHDSWRIHKGHHQIRLPLLQGSR